MGTKKETVLTDSCTLDIPEPKKLDKNEKTETKLVPDSNVTPKRFSPLLRQVRFLITLTITRYKVQCRHNMNVF